MLTIGVPNVWKLATPQGMPKYKCGLMKTLHTPTLPADRRGFFAFASLCAVLVASSVVAYDGLRIGQVLWLAAPAVLWLMWPVRSPAWHRLRTLVVFAWTLLFVADAMTRAYLMQAYQAAPDSAVVLGAAANSNPREQSEYLQSSWRSILAWSIPLILFAVVGGWLAERGARTTTRPRWITVSLCVLLGASVLAYASKSWRRLHPAVFWTTWASTASDLRAGWTDQQAHRDAVMARASALAPTIVSAGPSTLVWVISDSVNRDNMSLYGYGRSTTPRLIEQRSQVGNQMTVLRNAWSTDASTLPALRNMFSFGAPERADSQHILALARTAGYKVWWMSNHDDIAVDQQHARFADVVEMINRTPGRSGTSMDGELLDGLREAIEDGAQRKLIVVHLLGAHPHYELRFPPDGNPFDDEVDTIERGLIDQGRSSWVRRSRQEYDAAMLYHDAVVAQTLQLTRMAGSPIGSRAWMYLSDHGQEVGHDSDRTGHSPSTASGYRIPAIVWRNDGPALPSDVGQRPFRSDWTAWTIADLLGLEWAGQSKVNDVLDPAYVWRAPVLPPRIDDFSR